MIRLEAGLYGWDFIIRNVETDETILVERDYDYPGIAQTFGWVPCDECNDSDGTVDCAHKTASEMIREAREYLNDNIDEEVEDPGYFNA